MSFIKTKFPCWNLGNGTDGLFLKTENSDKPGKIIVLFRKTGSFSTEKIEIPETALLFRKFRSMGAYNTGMYFIMCDSAGNSEVMDDLKILHQNLYEELRHKNRVLNATMEGKKLIEMDNTKRHNEVLEEEVKKLKRFDDEQKKRSSSPRMSEITT